MRVLVDGRRLHGQRLLHRTRLRLLMGKSCSRLRMDDRLEELLLLMLLRWWLHRLQRRDHKIISVCHDL